MSAKSRVKKNSIINRVNIGRKTVMGPIASMLVFFGASSQSMDVVADATIVFKEIGVDAKISPMVISNGKVRITPPGQGNGYVIFDSAINTMTHVDDKNKSYTVMDESAFNAMADTLSQMQKSVMAQMQGLPPEKRAQMEAMMGQMMGQSMTSNTQTTREFRKTKKRKDIAGYQCTVIENVKQGIKTSEICVVDRKETPLSAQDFASLRQFLDFMKKLADKLPGAEEMKEEFGFWESDVNIVPVQIVRYEKGAIKSTHQVEQISTASVAAEDFKIPSDYKRRSLMPGL